MKNEIKILKDWLESYDSSLCRLREIMRVCSNIVSVRHDAAYDAHADTVAYDHTYDAAVAAVAAYAAAREKVKTLVDLIESHTSNNTNNNDNAQKLSELSKDELINIFGHVPINQLDFTLNDLIRALK